MERGLAMTTNDKRTNAISIRPNEQLPVPPRPLDGRIAEEQKDYLRRQVATEAMVRTAGQAVTRIVDLNVYGVQEFAQGTENIVKIVETPNRSPMAQEPIEAYGKRRINAMAQQTEATIDNAAYNMARTATASYDVSSNGRKLSMGERIRGRTDY